MNYELNTGAKILALEFGVNIWIRIERAQLLSFSIRT